MESGSRISYTRTLKEQTLVYLSVSPPNLSVMLLWNNLADPHLSVFSDFSRFSQTLTLKRLRIPTGRRQTSCLCENTAEELNLILPEINPAGGQGPISRKSRNLFGPEKQVVKLESA